MPLSCISRLGKSLSVLGISHLHFSSDASRTTKAEGPVPPTQGSSAAGLREAQALVEECRASLDDLNNAIQEDHRIAAKFAWKRLGTANQRLNVGTYDTIEAVKNFRRDLDLHFPAFSRTFYQVSKIEEQVREVEGACKEQSLDAAMWALEYLEKMSAETTAGKYARCMEVMGLTVDVCRLKQDVEHLRCSTDDCKAVATAGDEPHADDRKAVTTASDEPHGDNRKAVATGGDEPSRPEPSVLAVVTNKGYGKALSRLKQKWKAVKNTSGSGPEVEKLFKDLKDFSAALEAKPPGKQELEDIVTEVVKGISMRVIEYHAQPIADAMLTVLLQLWTEYPTTRESIREAVVLQGNSKSKRPTLRPIINLLHNRSPHDVDRAVDFLRLLVSEKKSDEKLLISCQWGRLWQLWLNPVKSLTFAKQVRPCESRLGDAPFVPGDRAGLL